MVVDVQDSLIIVFTKKNLEFKVVPPFANLTEVMMRASSDKQWHFPPCMITVKSSARASLFFLAIAFFVFETP